MPRPKDGPPIDAVRAALAYDPQTGQFERLKRCGKMPKGPAVGYVRPDGYLAIGVAGRQYLAHRLAHLLMTGAWPTMLIDHISGDKLDNRWANLRHVDDQTNNENWVKPRKTKSSSRYLGVFAKRNKWVASVTYQSRNYRLGTFDNEEDAHAAYVEAKRRLHKGCTL